MMCRAVTAPVAAIVLAVIALAACGQPSAPGANAQDQDATVDPGLSDADRSALLAAAGYDLAGDGTVLNLCDDRVTPQILPADVGGAVGVAQLVIVPGGPSLYTCYGDVPGDMRLMMRDGDAFRVIFTGGGYISILPETGVDGVHDLALGGPGFEFPVFSWTGSGYARADRTISDEEYVKYPSLP
jgi:hypothetical protein